MHFVETWWEKGWVELDSDLQALFKTLKDDELLETVIARVQRYAVEASGKTVDRDFRSAGLV